MNKQQSETLIKAFATMVKVIATQDNRYAIIEAAITISPDKMTQNFLCDLLDSIDADAVVSE